MSEPTDEQVVAEWMEWGVCFVASPQLTREVERKLAEAHYEQDYADHLGGMGKSDLYWLMTATDAQRVKAAAETIRRMES